MINRCKNLCLKNTSSALFHKRIIKCGQQKGTTSIALLVLKVQSWVNSAHLDHGSERKDLLTTPPLAELNIPMMLNKAEEM